MAALELLDGPEAQGRAEAAASVAAERMGLSQDNGSRLARGVTAAAALAGRPDGGILLTVGLSLTQPGRVLACLRIAAADVAPDEEKLAPHCDELSIRNLPGGSIGILMRFRMPEARLDALPASVSGEAADRAIQALSFVEHAGLAERRARTQTEELLGVIAHSLRNPIGSMASAADLLQISPGDPSTLEAATGILARSSRAALRLIADLEQLHQIDAGTLRLDIQQLRPSHVADSAAEVARSLAQRRSVDIQVSKEAGTRCVLADSDRLIQAIGNLVVASVEQAPEGSAVALRTRVEEDWIVFEVEDSGPHVPVEALPTLFDRLRKAGPRRRSAGAFGLAAARELIEVLSGRLTCVSVLGATTTMRAFLPGK